MVSTTVAWSFLSYRKNYFRRIVMLDGHQHGTALLHRMNNNDDPLLVFDKQKKRKIIHTWEANAHIKDHGLEDFEEGDCKAMHDWQLQSYPSCNNIHEHDFLDYIYITSGGWRDVWKSYEYDGEPFVVKTLVFEDTDFRFRDAERHRRDANIYSMLQGSNHIMNIYGYCVNTAFFDFVDGGTLYDKLKNKSVAKWSSSQKLKYSWQLAKAVSDLHGVGNIHGSSAIAHTDISPDQFLWFDGMFKLNDFNRARFIRWNSVKQEACPFQIGLAPGRNRSPEEYCDGSPLTEKIDVYSLGNAFMQILTQSTKVLPQLREKDAIQAIKDGQVTLDMELIQSLDEMELAISHAMKMCHVKDPVVRSSASEVEFYLRSRLNELHIDMS